MTDENFLMKPKNDYVFKKIFGDAKNKELLISLLDAILQEKVLDAQVDNSELLKENISDKKSILDIRATVNNGIEVDIEIQVSRTVYMPARSLYYWSKIYSEQLNIGEKYSGLKKTICINIVDFEATKSKKYHSTYKVKEIEEHLILTDLLQIHFLEMTKLPKYDENDVLSQWLSFIKANSRGELKKMAVANKEISKALEILETMSQSKEERAAYLSREMALHDEATRIEEAIEGGYEKGIEKGAIDKAIIIAKKMIKRGDSIEEVVDITELSTEQVLDLINKYQH